MLDVATILTSLRLRTSEMSARSVGGDVYKRQALRHGGTLRVGREEDRAPGMRAL